VTRGPRAPFLCAINRSRADRSATARGAPATDRAGAAPAPGRGLALRPRPLPSRLRLAADAGDVLAARATPLTGATTDCRGEAGDRSRAWRRAGLAASRSLAPGRSLSDYGAAGLPIASLADASAFPCLSQRRGRRLRSVRACRPDRWIGFLAPRSSPATLRMDSSSNVVRRLFMVISFAVPWPTGTDCVRG